MPESIDIYTAIPTSVEGLTRFGETLDQHPITSRGDPAFEVVIPRWLKIRTRRGGHTNLRANAVQRAFERSRGSQNIILKARQMGLTTWIAARFFIRTITHPGTLTLQVAHTQQAAEEIFRIVHRFLNSLPEEMRTGPLKTSRANVRQITFPLMDCEYRVVTAGDRNAGRGLTAQNLHCSELARWPGDPAETLAGLRAALSPEGELALESTPNGIGGCFYEEWQSAQETGLVRHFYPWWMEPSYSAASVDPASLTDEERSLQSREKLSLAQIGYRRQLRSSFHTLTPQEYAEDPETCFLQSGESIFELAAIEARLPDVYKPVQLRDNGRLCIWLPPMPEKKYLVAVDPAGGGSEGDNSAVQVLDLETGLQCAEFAGHVGGLELAELASQLAAEYNQAWLVIERNGCGESVLAYADMHCHYPRIYFSDDGKAGRQTTSVSRPAMLARLGAALVESPGCFASHALLAECRSFVRHPNGSSGARAGTHDDRVMAMAIALAASEELLAAGC